MVDFYGKSESKGQRREGGQGRRAIIVRRGDYTIEVSNEAELRAVLRVLDETVSAPARNGVPTAVAAESPGVAEQRIWEMFLDESARLYMRVLASHPDGLTDNELRERLGLRDNNQLGARTAAVVRTLKSAGANADKVLIRHRQGRPGSRTYTYKLAESIIEVIQSATEGLNTERQGQP